MAKTSNSLTGDPNVKGAPTGFKIEISDIFVSVGAGFIVPMVGEVSFYLFIFPLIFFPRDLFAIEKEILIKIFILIQI